MLKIPEPLETIEDIKKFIIGFIRYYNYIEATILGGATLPLKKMGDCYQQLTTGELQNLIITAEKIANLTITAEKIAALAITSEKIDALAVTTEKIGALAVTAEKIKELAVTSTKIGALAVYIGHLYTDVAGFLQQKGTDRNLLDNPGFEDGSRSWQTGTGRTFLTTGGKDSNGCLKSTGQYTGCSQLILEATPRYYEVNEGDVVYYGGDLKSGDGTQDPYLQLWIYDKDKTYATKLQDASAKITAVDWTAVSKVYTVPAGRKFIQFMCSAGTKVTGDGYFDNLFFKIVIQTNDLGDLAVTVDKIANLAISTAKIANLAIATGKIEDAAITTEKLGALAVVAEKIANLTITVGKFTNDVGGKLEEGGTDRNLLDNPGFEGGSRSWKTGTGISFEDTGGNQSNGYLKLTRSGANNNCVQTTLDGVARKHEVNGGDVVYFGGDAKSSNGSVVATIKMACWDKDDNVLANPSCQTTEMAWTTISTTYTIPAAGKFVKFQSWAMTADGDASFDNLFLKKVIQSADIENLAITAGKIADLAIVAGKIASLTITAAQIANLTIVAGKIGVDETLGKDSIGTIAVAAGGAGAVPHGQIYPVNHIVSMFSPDEQNVYQLGAINDFSDWDAGWKIFIHSLGTMGHVDKDGDMEKVGTADWWELPDPPPSGLSKVASPVHGGAKALKVAVTQGTECMGGQTKSIFWGPVGSSGCVSFTGWVRNGNATNAGLVIMSYDGLDWTTRAYTYTAETSEYVEKKLLRVSIPAGTTHVRMIAHTIGAIGTYAYYDDFKFCYAEKCTVVRQMGDVPKTFKIRNYREQAGT